MRNRALLVLGAAGIAAVSLAAAACGSDAIGAAPPSLPDAAVSAADGSSSSGGPDGASPPDASAPDVAAEAYSIGGTVSGLEAGDSVVLKNGTGPGHSVTTNGTFAMPERLPSGASYGITVDTPPSKKKCTVTNGTGSVAAANVTDVVVECVVSCGDGVLDPGEQCDDGNAVDVDGCANACTKNPIYLGGNSGTFIDNGLALVGESFVSAGGGGSFGAAPSSGILISANNGGDPPFPTNWQTFLDAGGHILVVGGSNSSEYRTFIGGFLTIDDATTFHQSDDCTSDWTKIVNHPITQLMPLTYEFANPSTSFHMLHFATTQPTGTTVLAQTCHAAGETGVLAVRTYASGGTFTYLAFDIGTYTGANTPAQFVQPLLDGYLKYVRSKR